MKHGSIDQPPRVVGGCLPEVSGASAPIHEAVQACLQAGVTVLRAVTPDAVTQCRQLAGGGAEVWAAVPPSGHLLVLREIEPADLAAEFGERLKPLVERQPDALVFRAFTDVEEAVIALQAAREVCTLPLWVTMTFGCGADQIETVLRHSCDEVARRLQAAGAGGIGCECGVTIDEAVLITRLMRAESPLPLLVCPDAGQRELEGDHVVYRETPELFASKISCLVSAGANLIGGCCGVSAAHLAAAVRALREQPPARCKAGKAK